MGSQQQVAPGDKECDGARGGLVNAKSKNVFKRCEKAFGR